MLKNELQALSWLLKLKGSLCRSEGWERGSSGCNENVVEGFIGIALKSLPTVTVNEQLSKLQVKRILKSDSSL